MMMNRSNLRLLMLLVVIGVAVASENYLDYGDGTADKNLESQREFYRVLLRRNAAVMGEWPSQIFSHLMTRKSQRSPSLRLRFGRSEPVMPAGILTRQEDGPSPFDNN